MLTSVKYLGAQNTVEMWTDLPHINNSLAKFIEYRGETPIESHVPNSVFKNTRLLCELTGVEYSPNLITVTDRFAELREVKPAHDIVTNLVNIREQYYKDTPAAYRARYDLERIIAYETNTVPVLVPSTIDPIIGTFDLRTDGPHHQAISTKLSLNGNVLSGLKLGDTELIEGTDYTISGDVYTFSLDMLDALVEGDYTIIFETDYGARPMLNIEVIQSEYEVYIEPESGAYDFLEPSNIVFKLYASRETGAPIPKFRGEDLEVGTDYTAEFSDDSTYIEYTLLSSSPKWSKVPSDGIYDIVFSNLVDYPQDVTFALTIINVPKAYINPTNGVFNALQPDTKTITLRNYNHSTPAGLLLNGVGLVKDTDYSVTSVGSGAYTYTVFVSAMEGLSNGIHNLVFLTEDPIPHINYYLVVEGKEETDYIFYSEFKQQDPSWLIRGGSFEFGVKGMYTPDNGTKGTINATELGYDYNTNFVKIIDANASINGDLSEMGEILMLARVDNTVANNRIGGIKVTFYNESGNALSELAFTDGWGASKNMSVSFGQLVSPYTGIGTGATSIYNNLETLIKIKIGNDNDPNYCELWVNGYLIGSNSVPSISTAKSMMIFVNAYLESASYPMPETSLLKFAISKKQDINSLAEYTFDNTDGRTVYDTTGNGYDVTANVDFDLVNSFVGKGRGGAPASNSNGFGSPEWLDLVQSGEFSFSFWVNTSYLNSSGNWVFLMGHSTLGGSSNENLAKLFYLKYAPNGSLVVDNTIAFGGSTNSQSAGVIRLKLNNPEDMNGHWVVQGDWNDTYNFKAYRNGEFYGEFTQEPNGPPANNADLFGAYKSTGANNDLLQSIDQFRVFDRIIDEDTIRKLYEEQDMRPVVTGIDPSYYIHIGNRDPIYVDDCYIQATNNPTSYRLGGVPAEWDLNVDTNTGRIMGELDVGVYTFICYASNQYGESDGKVVELVVEQEVKRRLTDIYTLDEFLEEGSNEQ